MRSVRQPTLGRHGQHQPCPRRTDPAAIHTRTHRIALPKQKNPKALSALGLSGLLCFWYHRNRANPKAHPLIGAIATRLIGSPASSARTPRAIGPHMSKCTQTIDCTSSEAVRAGVHCNGEKTQNVARTERSEARRTIFRGGLETRPLPPGEGRGEGKLAKSADRRRGGRRKERGDSTSKPPHHTPLPDGDGTGK